MEAIVALNTVMPLKKSRMGYLEMFHRLGLLVSKYNAHFYITNCQLSSFNPKIFKFIRPAVAALMEALSSHMTNTDICVFEAYSMIRLE